LTDLWAIEGLLGSGTGLRLREVFSENTPLKPQLLILLFQTLKKKLLHWLMR